MMICDQKAIAVKLLSCIAAVIILIFFISYTASGSKAVGLLVIIGYTVMPADRRSLERSHRHV